MPITSLLLSESSLSHCCFVHSPFKAILVKLKAAAEVVRPQSAWGDHQFTNQNSTAWATRLLTLPVRPTRRSMPQPYESGCDLNSPNRNLAPITAELDDQGRLAVGGCALSELANRYGTPLYVLDEDTVRGTCRAYRDALQMHYPGESLPVYASKANSSLLMSSIAAAEGLGLDAVSAGELLTALQGGMPGERMVLHGNNKNDEELLLAYNNNVTVVVDNQHDLDR